MLGDKERDIFDGLNVATSLVGEARYVAAEDVDTIVEGTITLAR